MLFHLQFETIKTIYPTNISLHHTVYLLAQGSAIVTVTVADENDHTPQCNEMPFAFSTDEANSNQVVLGIVTATDGDGPDIGSGQLVYQLASSNLGDTITVSSTVSA